MKTHSVTKSRLIELLLESYLRAEGIDLEASTQRMLERLRPVIHGSSHDKKPNIQILKLIMFPFRGEPSMNGPERVFHVLGLLFLVVDVPLEGMILHLIDKRRAVKEA